MKIIIAGEDWKVIEVSRSLPPKNDRALLLKIGNEAILIHGGELASALKALGWVAIP